MKISALLNPLVEKRRSFDHRPQQPQKRMRDTTFSPSSSGSREEQVLARAQRGSSEAKDAPKFVRGQTVGDVLYPVHYPTSAKLHQQMKRYAIYPESDIESYPRHIPYSSDKKRFAAKTGRDALEVFQYTFRYEDVPDDDEDKENHEDHTWWTVMWDYNIGLVRITPFFKSQDYPKTIPARVITQNLGLADICHSITGGSIVAQGYWMPFEAAKAVAATFCYKIRYALVPMFGPEFAKMCTHPSSPAYRRFKIDDEIISRCAQNNIQPSKAKKQRRASQPARRTQAHSLSPTLVAASQSDRPLRKRHSLRDFEDSSDEYDSVGETNMHTASESASPAHQRSTPITPTRARRAPPQKGSGFRIPAEFRWIDVNNRVQKRRVAEMETDSDNAASKRAVPTNKKKRKPGCFTADEARAAYQLLELRYS